LIFYSNGSVGHWRDDQSDSRDTDHSLNSIHDNPEVLYNFLRTS